MSSRNEREWIGIGWKRVGGMAMAGMLVGAMAMALIAGAAALGNSRAEERAIDRGEAEYLQRWVSAGHEDWCKDARLVAAEELKRLAEEYSGDGFELNLITSDADSNGGNRVTFEWAPPDGRELYRVTVEGFDWLLLIAKNVDSIGWGPTTTAILTQEWGVSIGCA